MAQPEQGSWSTCLMWSVVFVLAHVSDRSPQNSFIVIIKTKFMWPNHPKHIYFHFERKLTDATTIRDWLNSPMLQFWWSSYVSDARTILVRDSIFMRADPCCSNSRRKCRLLSTQIVIGGKYARFFNHYSMFFKFVCETNECIQYSMSEHKRLAGTLDGMCCCPISAFFFKIKSNTCCILWSRKDSFRW